MLEATTEDFGIIDAILHTDGVGLPFLHMVAGGSVYPASKETVKQRQHTVYQEGRSVYKYAVSNMSQVTMDILEKNHLKGADVDWFIPHQANLRIIEAVGSRMDIDPSKILVNIDHVGNTSAASVPLCLWENEAKLKKGDNLVLSTFGAGFTWGSLYMKWGYDPE